MSFKKFLPLILGVAIAAGIFIGGKLNFTDAPDRLFSSNSKKDKLNRLIDYIDYEYVDEVNTDSIVDVTVNGILENLDPHSVYIPKEDMQQSTESLQGDFVGIGINFYTYRDTITVIRAVENGPSDKAGIKGGDRIVYANGDSIFGKNLTDEQIVSHLKGPINSKVDLQVYRQGEPELLEFTIKRDHIPIVSVDAAYMLNDNLGYIKINRFAESTYKEFKVKLDELINEGVSEIVIDLRNNHGGFLHIAEQILDEFLEDNTLMLFTKNKRDKVEKRFATKKGDFEEGRVFVLIDENSASASEIVAGALQDNDKGIIVGRRSYGKGLVQREMELGDGSAVRLTVSRYYTPTGRSIQRSYENGNNDYYHDYFDRLDSGELLDSAKIKVADSLKFKTPKGKIVYGGGGIIPDIFVPIDNSMHNETLRFLQRRGFISYFVFEELEKDRKRYEGISKEDYIKNFEVSDDFVVAFQDYLNIRTESEITFVAYNKEIKQYIKATLADQLFGDGAYEEIINQNDLMIEEVINYSKEHSQD
ncbi:S41 family peptidase [Yeosuana sp. MJ-SS3]|uniref:S41 family peptidase n=1 Tax=Gilvirhabdus luticola TaxID=3079858 RepID=A0ABU3U8J7_9FLAO|nr:S41 family peptidase [Yeosuana sp. MJ-SS3]MDU8886728.1 S41 family peptidase [Yeosuana sp. MJ-SS3]